MKFININGPINSGKSTISKLLVEKLPNAVFIEVDDLLSDEEQTRLSLDFKGGIKERLKRLSARLKLEKESSLYDYLIFAYPLNNKNYTDWAKLANKESPLICITLSPSLEMCITNRGARELTEAEIKRIKEMYEQFYHCPDSADLIVYNDNHTPERTVDEIVSFLGEYKNV